MSTLLVHIGFTTVLLQSVMLKLLMPKLNIFPSVAYVLSITHYFLEPIHCIGYIYQVYGPLIPTLITIDYTGGHFAGIIQSR